MDGTLVAAIIGPEFAEAGRDSGRLGEIFSIAKRFSIEVEDAFESLLFSARAANDLYYKIVPLYNT